MKGRINKREVGSFNEELAARFLEKEGYVILERNFRCRIGEIDIIAADKEGSRDVLCFIEVKYRFDSGSGAPGEAINAKKQRIIYRVAEYFLYSKGFQIDVPCRFDAVVIEKDNIELIKDAFGSLSS